MNKAILILILLFYLNEIGHSQNNKRAENLSFVPSPWTPLEVKQRNQAIFIKCWGREYVFNRTLLPSQIYSADEPLLKRPIQLEINSGNKILKFDSASVKINVQTAAAVNLETKSISGNIEVKVAVHIEYDGLMLITLTTNQPNTNSFSLDIAYNQNVSEYYIKYASNPNADIRYSDSLPAKEGILLSSSFIPYLWIGNNYKGLFWFCESPESWPGALNSNAIQITRRQNIVTEKFNLGSVSSYQFGIQATPVKPFPDNWRNLRFAPAVNATIQVLWPQTGNPSSTKYFGWPQAVNDDNYINQIKKYHEKNKKVIAYASITTLPSVLPVYQQNKNLWQRAKVPMKIKADSLIFIEPNSKNYREFVTNQLTDYLVKYNLDGYYLDLTKSYPFVKNNQKYYPILGYRELQKELYTSIKAKNPNALIIGHMSGNIDIPVLSFVDGYLDGEQFTFIKNGEKNYSIKQSYLDVINLNQFRAEFIGKQFGIISFFLPEFDAASAKTIQPTLGLVSLLAIHDVQPWPLWSNISVWNELYKQLDAFSFQQSNFIPYYSNNPPAQTGNLNNVYVSAYSKTNEALIIVSNLSKEKVNGTITLNPQTLGLQKINSVYVLPNNTKIDFVQNKILVNLDALSYQLFWVK